MIYLKKVSLFLAIILSQSLFAQDSLTILQVKEDLNIFKTSILEAHPGIEIYKPVSTEEKFTQLCDDYLKSITSYEKISRQDFYKNLKRITTTIQDGHTDLKPNGHMIDYNHLLPFHFKVLYDKIYITKTFSTFENVPVYSEVISINGYSTEEILAKIYECTPADGNFIGFKEDYNSIIFSRQFGELIEATRFYDLTLKNTDGEMFQIKVEGISDDILHSKTVEKPLVFTPFKEDNYAILDVNTFQYRQIMQSGIDYHDFLENSFKQLRKDKIDHLIIDLRDNYGGESILALTLYSYIIEGNFSWIKSSITKLHEPITFAEYTNYPKGNYRFLKTHKVEDLGDGWWKLTEGIDSKSTYNSDFIYKANGKPENISKNKFKGRVYLLINGLTFSAASNFAGVCYTNREAIIIGSAMGGAYGDHCGGGFLTVQLPNANFTLQIPFMRRQKGKLEIDRMNINVVFESITDPNRALETTVKRIVRK